MHMELTFKKINFLGDSITQGVGTSGTGYIYCDLVGRELGAEVRNYGISGTRFARQYSATVGNPSFDQNFCDRALTMDGDADAVVVFGGTNDFGHGDAPIGDVNCRGSNTFCGSVHELFTRLITKYPAATIVVLTPLHRTNEDNPRGDGYKKYDYGTLKVYVEKLREIAEFYSLPVLDLYATSGLQPRVPIIKQTYCPDGLHPNDAGHEILAKKLGAFLTAL
jgi:lysophospholipase L1-like esterase